MKKYQVGKAIKLIRELKGWRMSHLSRASNVSKGCLSKIESGSDNIELKTFFAIAEALVVFPNYILDVAQRIQEQEDQAPADRGRSDKE